MSLATVRKISGTTMLALLALAFVLAVAALPWPVVGQLRTYRPEVVPVTTRGSDEMGAAVQRELSATCRQARPRPAGEIWVRDGN